MSKPHKLSAIGMSRLVLVVDDDPRVRQSIESLLSSAGFEVRLYASAADLLASHAIEVAGCLITDIRMPAVDGWQLQRRTASIYPDLPVIFVTAHQDEGAFESASSGGAFALFYKPFDGEELLATVEAALPPREISSGS